MPTSAGDSRKGTPTYSLPSAAVIPPLAFHVLDSFFISFILTPVATFPPQQNLSPVFACSMFMGEPSTARTSASHLLLLCAPPGPGC